MGWSAISRKQARTYCIEDAIFTCSLKDTSSPGTIKGWDHQRFCPVQRCFDILTDTTARVRVEQTKASSAGPERMGPGPPSHNCRDLKLSMICKGPYGNAHVPRQDLSRAAMVSDSSGIREALGPKQRYGMNGTGIQQIAALEP